MLSLDTHILHREGRSLSPPFCLRLAGAGEDKLTCTEILRHLPGKRLVCGGNWQGRGPVVVKVFLDPTGAERHCRRERQGIQAMQEAHIPTPELLLQGHLADGQAPLLIFRKMEGFENLAEHLDKTENTQERIDAMGLAVASIARLHEAGLRQRDVHPGNFLLSGGTVMVIDGDDIEKSDRRPLPPQESLSNLALFYAQFPAQFDGMAPWLTEAYASIRNWPPGRYEDHSIADQIEHWREWRLKKFLPKTRRACTAFRVQKDWHRFMACDREWYSPGRRKLLDDPDVFIETGTILKAGNSATVAKINLEGQDLVIKRYNLKNATHTLSRSLRPSRAMVSWENAHRLRFLGINTPPPLAVIEERWGILRKRAFFIMAHQPGKTIDQVLQTVIDSHRAVDRCLDQLEVLLKQLAAARISHGDFKATNFLLSANQLYLVDLDGMRAHRSGSNFRRAFLRDMQRLARNWENIPQISDRLAGRIERIISFID